MIGYVELCIGLYILKVDQSPIGHDLRTWCQTVSYESNKDSAIMLWHFLLGYPNFRYLKRLFPSLFANKDLRSFHCDICQLSKCTPSNYSPCLYKLSHHFSLIHGDIWRLTKIPNVKIARWFLSLVDDHTCLSWTFLMK